MSNTVKWVIGGSLAVIAGAVLIMVGVLIGMALWQPAGGWINSTGMMPHALGMGPGWAGSGQGMMGMMGGGYLPGAPRSGSYSGEELAIEQVEERLEEYLGESDEFEIGEIMIFDNHAYAQIIEAATGIGAMEVLVDPLSLGITPEHGPNMMWNLKYGGMHRGGPMGTQTRWDEANEMTMDAEKAVEIAQEYLDQTSTGLTADEHADPFYGYYTIHTFRDGSVEGMLSVNGYTGQVFPHTWHGELITMSGEGDH
jgi:hypothetical protein